MNIRSVSQSKLAVMPRKPLKAHPLMLMLIPRSVKMQLFGRKIPKMQMMFSGINAVMYG